MNPVKSKRDLDITTDDFVGTWWLQSRKDTATDGSVRSEPTLGPDALGILTYANGKFAAQFMKRDRENAVNIRNPKGGLNNTGAVDGYDAYFGNYSVDESTGEVLHRLEGALTADNVGMKVSRRLTVSGNRLTILVDTTTLEGEPVTRTLTWKRIA
jgi:hypothetical protein